MTMRPELPKSTPKAALDYIGLLEMRLDDANRTIKEHRPDADTDTFVEGRDYPDIKLPAQAKVVFLLDTKDPRSRIEVRKSNDGRLGPHLNVISWTSDLFVAPQAGNVATLFADVPVRKF